MMKKNYMSKINYINFLLWLMKKKILSNSNLTLKCINILEFPLLHSSITSINTLLHFQTPIRNNSFENSNLSHPTFLSTLTKLWEYSRIIWKGIEIIDKKFIFFFSSIHRFQDFWLLISLLRIKRKHANYLTFLILQEGTEVLSGLANRHSSSSPALPCKEYI